VFYVPLFVFSSFGHCIICPSSIYSFRLPLWYIQIFLEVTLGLLVGSVLLISLFSFVLSCYMSLRSEFRVISVTISA